MHFLGGQERKAGGQVESHLPAERGQRAGSSAVGFLVPVIEHVTHEIEVLLHRDEIIARYPRRLNARAAGSPTSKRSPPAQTRHTPPRRSIPEDRSRPATPASGR